MNQWGTHLRLSLFGESHGPGVGVVLDGVPAGLPIDETAIHAALEARRPGTSPLVSQRDEPDHAAILSGVFEGHATGAPLALWIANLDARSRDYANATARPGHADWTEHVASGGHRDPRGGGHQSGRLTAPLVAAGALLQPFLDAHGVRCAAHVHAIGPVRGPDGPIPAAAMAARAATSPVRTAHRDLEALMVAEVEAARAARDSVGGDVRFSLEGLPPGAGSPHFGGIEPMLASLLLAIPGAKAVGFGSGVQAAGMRGSEHNDPLVALDGAVTTATNHAGGILGGRATGAPVWGTLTLKPTSTIAQPQASIDLATLQPATAQGRGRHDPCIAIRATAVVRACLQVAAADLLLGAQATGLAMAPSWPREDRPREAGDARDAAPGNGAAAAVRAAPTTPAGREGAP